MIGFASEDPYGVVIEERGEGEWWACVMGPDGERVERRVIAFLRDDRNFFETKMGFPFQSQIPVQIDLLPGEQWFNMTYGGMIRRVG